MTVVVDASALVAVFTAGEAGDWVAGQIEGEELAATHLAGFEAANILRRHEAAGLLPPGDAASAHADLVALRLDLASYDAVAERSWQLRANLTIYDASYAALAEALDAPLVTLDRRIAGAPGIGCEVRTPPD